MKKTGIVRRLDDLGRIVIPKELRIKFFGKPNILGRLVEIYLDKDSKIILNPYPKKTTENLKAFDDLGRVYINKEIRKAIFGSYDTGGKAIEFFTDKNKSIIMQPYPEE